MPGMHSSACKKKAKEKVCLQYYAIIKTFNEQIVFLVLLNQKALEKWDFCEGRLFFQFPHSPTEGFVKEIDIILLL